MCHSLYLYRSLLFEILAFITSPLPPQSLLLPPRQLISHLTRGGRGKGMGKGVGEWLSECCLKRVRICMRENSYALLIDNRLRHIFCLLMELGQHDLLVMNVGVLLFYVRFKHLRSCRDGQLT